METANNINFNDIAVTVGALVAVALALATAIGPTVMYITEALKRAFNVADGKGGLVALAISILLTSILAVVTTYVTQESAGTREYIAAVGIGAVLGVFVGGGAVQSYKAAGSINPTDIQEQFQALLAELNSEDDSARIFDSWITPSNVSDDVPVPSNDDAIIAAGPNK